MANDYIHGVSRKEQDRLSLLNELTNASFLSFLKMKDESKVLEIGSGLGIFSEKVARKYKKSEITGLEYSVEQIEKCNKTIENLKFVRGDAHELPFDNNKFDFIYGRYILEHLKNPQKALSEVYRVLKSGGRVYFQENTISLMKLYPYCPSFDSVWKKFIKLQDVIGGDAEIGIKLFSLLKDVGFTEVVPTISEEIHYADRGTLNAWVENLIGNIEGASDSLIKYNLSTHDEIKEAIRELKSFTLNPNSLALFYWNRISGIK